MANIPARDETSEREQLLEEISTLMGPLVRVLRGAFLECAAEARLTATEAQALWLLAARGSMSTKELARALDIDPANASTLVGKLERRELVSRVPARDDRRRRVISLSPAGRRLRLRLANCVGQRRPTFRELSTGELGVFRDLLLRMRETQAPAG